MPVEKISNGDFTNFSQDWTTVGPGTYFSGGTASFNGGNETTFGAYIEQTFSAAVGSTQTVSMDLFEIGAGVSDQSFQIDVLDANSTVIASHSYTVPDGGAVPVTFTFVPTTPTSTLRITNTNATDTNASDGRIDNVSVVCFADGTLIDTMDGPIPVEALTPGMALRTIRGNAVPLRLTLSRRFSRDHLQNDRLRPVRIIAGALGNGLPRRDLLVSRQHRMLVSSPIAQRMFGTHDILIPAIRLTDMPGIFVDDTLRDITYFHLVLDQHDVILAEGAPSESFLPGVEAIAALTDAARAELFAVFPHLRLPQSPVQIAFKIPGIQQQRRMITRHLKNAKPLSTPLPVCAARQTDRLGLCPRQRHG